MNYRNVVAGLIAASSAVSSYAAAAAEPYRVQIPSHILWCVRSQPVDLAAQQDSQFGNVVFMALYGRLEMAALNSAIDSFGVPFLESVTDAPVLQLPPASSLTNEAPPAPLPVFLVIRVCVTVSAAAPAPPARVERVHQAAREVYAIRCNADEIEECRMTIITKMKADGFSVPDADYLIWSTRQALESGDSADDLVRDLSDSTFRPLKKGDIPSWPQHLVAVAAELPK
jgi:hypothetical protein